MALRAVPDHPKFAHLKTLLKLGKGATLGYLECIWHFAGRFTPQGNIGKYSDSQIENWVEWPGEPGALISALLESRWLDRDDVHRLLVHDWAQHADKATKNALKRAKSVFCKPAIRTQSVQCPNTTPNSGTISRLPVPVPEPEAESGPELSPAKAASCDVQLGNEPFNLTDEEPSDIWNADGTSRPVLQAKGSQLDSEVENEVDQVAHRIRERHPVVRRCGLRTIKQRLVSILKRVPARNRMELLHSIDRNHAAWCSTAEWQKEDGQYAKGLENWLAPTKERWSEPPATTNRESDSEPPRLMM